MHYLSPISATCSESIKVIVPKLVEKSAQDVLSDYLDDLSFCCL